MIKCYLNNDGISHRKDRKYGVEKAENAGYQVLFSLIYFRNVASFYHRIPNFDNPLDINPLKTLLEKETMLITSILSFSHNVFLFPQM